jgi:hypothetical protein
VSPSEAAVRAALGPALPRLPGGGQG